MPRKVSDSARPRCSGGASATATPAASAANTEPVPISTRPISNTANEGADADSTQPAVNSPSARSIARLRGQRPVASRNSGARQAEVSA